MLNRLKESAKAMGIEIMFLENITVKGGYLPDQDIIFINAELDEKSMFYVLAHELSHAMEHKDYSRFYLSSAHGRSKMEYEAEKKAINILVTDYFNSADFNIEQINYINLMQYLGINASYERLVKDSITQITNIECI